MKLENERLCVEISELGAEVTRIRDKKNNAELLWEADPVYWKRHSPVLFPNVGKTYRNTVLINGTHYPTSQHGFARGQQIQRSARLFLHLFFLRPVKRRRKSIRLILSLLSLTR